MQYLLQNATVYESGSFFQTDLLLANGRIAAMGHDIPVSPFARVYNVKNRFVFPGFVDVHVHLREPGFVLKENIATGTAAGARGGYTTLYAMPNLNPVPDSPAHLQVQLDRIARTARVRVLPYGAITVGQQGTQLSDMAALAPHVAGFSDDGKGVQTESMMRLAMQQAKALGKIIVAHCEDESLLAGGYIHKGAYAAAHGHKGICSESEWRPLARDLELAAQTGCAYHVCHVSTKESVSLIRQAKQSGVDVTCETAPHYLLLDETFLKDDGRFKMNPPLRTPADREALLEGLADKTVDMIATDHAPHTAAEKSGGLKNSLMGVVGLETAFSVLYTGLIKPGLLPLERLIDCMSTKPAQRFGMKSGIFVGAPADLNVFNLEQSYTVDPEAFLSKGRSTPFAGRQVYGMCEMTFLEGEPIWKN